MIGYTAPRGESQGLNRKLEDLSYDGIVEGGMMRGGLGQLVDGLFGEDVFNPDDRDTSGELSISIPRVQYKYMGNSSQSWQNHVLAFPYFERNLNLNFPALKCSTICHLNYSCMILPKTII